MTTKEINIKVIIADRSYRLKVNPRDEEHVRVAAKLIKEKMQELQGMYGAKDKQDYLAMASLLLCVDLLEKESEIKTEDHGLKQKLDVLDELLTEFMQKG